MTCNTFFRRGLGILRRAGFARLATAGVFVSLAVLASWSFAAQGIIYAMFSGDLSAAEKIKLLQDFFGTLGPAAPLAYVAMVTGEVVLAPLPGAMLYAPGGIIFGGFWGGLLSLTGNVVGAGLACQIMRTLGRPYLERAMGRGALRKYESRLVRHGVWSGLWGRATGASWVACRATTRTPRNSFESLILASSASSFDSPLSIVMGTREGFTSVNCRGAGIGSRSMRIGRDVQESSMHRCACSKPGMETADSEPEHVR